VERRALIALGVVASGMVAAAGRGTPSAAGPLTGLGVLRPGAAAPAPDPAFRDLDGRQARLAEFRGRPLLLTFFTTW
jgi:cytochrome oxidase Cu insertion factor (SCO1/SenC/PrrC family)